MYHAEVEWGRMDVMAMVVGVLVLMFSVMVMGVIMVMFSVMVVVVIV